MNNPLLLTIAATIIPSVIAALVAIITIKVQTKSTVTISTFDRQVGLLQKERDSLDVRTRLEFERMDRALDIAHKELDDAREEIRMLRLKVAELEGQLRRA